MSNYQYRVFVDRLGKLDFVRKQPESSTTLTNSIDADDFNISVNSVLDLFGGDLGDVVTRIFRRNILITTDSVTVVSDGVASSYVFPEFWAGNDISVSVDGTPLTPVTDYTVNLNRVTLLTLPPPGAVIVASTVIESLTVPSLGREPTVTLNGTELIAPTDFVLESGTTTSRIVFADALSVSDNVNITVEYSRSGPDTVWINNEQVQFLGIDFDNNVLLQCRRGVNTTSPQSHSAGTVVWDGSSRQSLLAEAAKSTSGFTESDVNSFPWKPEIIDFLSSTEINT